MEKLTLTLPLETSTLCLNPANVKVFEVEILEDGPTPIEKPFLLFLHYEGIDTLSEQSLNSSLQVQVYQSPP